jgi:hypothetical protein
VPQDDPTNRAGEHTDPPAVPVVAPEQEAPEVPPTRVRRIPRRWLPWLAIIGVVTVALAIALPLTLGGSSSSVTPTPSVGTITGSYLTTSVQDSRLVFAALVQTGSEVSGSLTVTTTGPARKHLVARLYTVTGTVSGSNLDLTLTPTTGTTAASQLTATYVSGTITATIATGGTLTLRRGTLAAYRVLVKQERTTLLS